MINWGIGVLVLGCLLSGWAGAAAPIPTPVNPADSMDLADLRMFVDVMDEIRHSYVEPVSDHDLWVYAMRGMLESLDPHSAYLGKEDYQTLKEDTSGRFDGVGLELNRDAEGLKVVAPIDDSPAAKAGIRAGDRIVQLEGRMVQGQNTQEVLDQMRGMTGTHLHLTVSHVGDTKLQTYDLVRQNIALSTVHVHWLQPGYACVRISMFSELTGTEVVKAIVKLQKEGAIQGLVVDLRNNPGGVFQSAVKVADDFLSQGVIVSTHGRLADANQQVMATPDQILPGIPLIVLINGGTASAAEIVAGALQDHHRALVIGTTSFGKGSIQSVLSLSEGQGIKLTTAEYFTPNGRSIQAHGIVPDVVVEEASVQPITKEAVYKEANLAHHLDNPQAGTTKKNSNATDGMNQLLQTDFQLYQALTLLKTEYVLNYR